MAPQQTYQHISESVEEIRRRCADKPQLAQPQVGVILGSGLGSLADQVEDGLTIPYSSIPHFHPTNVEGHAGQIILGSFHGIRAVFLQGRFHYYEGYPMEEVVFPTRTLCGLGIHTLVLTNAAGGINTRYRAGDIMLIEDHVNLMGNNPLRGPNLAEYGPRFPDMSEAYSRECVDILRSCARELAIPVHSGVYAGVLGPTYETPAEVRMLRTMGADAVGMSTVPETIAANHLGVRVAGISCITNLAAGISPTRLTHQEVIDNSRLGTEKLRRLLEHAIPRMADTSARK